MRCVVFDPLDMEALTVIDVPQEFIRNLEQRRGPSMIHFGIPAEPATWVAPDAPMDYQPPKVATVLLEPFFRGNVRTWCAIAMNPEICLLLKAELLPGQHRDVQQMRRRSFEEGFGKGFLTALRTF